MQLRGGAESHRKERRRGRVGSANLVGNARRGAEWPLAEIRLCGHEGVRVGGDAHEVHEAGVARRGAPRLLRRGGDAEERLRRCPGLSRIDQVDASAHERIHRRGRLVAGNPHMVGNRLLGDLRPVIRDLARGGVGVGIVRRDTRDGGAGEEVRAGRVRRRRFEVDRVPPLRERHRLFHARQGESRHRQQNQ